MSSPTDWMKSEYDDLVKKGFDWKPPVIGGPSTGRGGRAVVSASHNVGLIFYQAGVVVLSSSIFHGSAQGDQGILDEHHFPEMDMTHTASVAGFSEPGPLNSIFKLFASSSISGACNALRHRIGNLSFNNTTELNSTIYFCRANANEFNYSSNPTYLKDSKIRVKADDSRAEPVSYITTVGLYGPNIDELGSLVVTGRYRAVTDECACRGGPIIGKQS